MLTGKALACDIFESRAYTEGVCCWWLGQMSFAFRCRETVLFIDPYVSDRSDRMIKPMLTAEQLARADFILGTHDHIDHIDRLTWPVLARTSKKTRFVTPRLLTSKVSLELGIERKRFIAIEEDQPFSDANLTIRGIASAHEFLNPDKETGDHPFLGYVVDIGGIRIYHAGDSCKYEGLERKLIDIGNIDLMILPINGRDAKRYRKNIIGNMTWQEAVDLAGSVCPGAVVPGHYDMFDFNRKASDVIDFCEYLEAKYPNQRFLIPAHGERFSITEKEIVLYR
jgi:L-ascorbate 6-phosphate lactonase